MMKGKMELWDDDKGYGFIRPDDGPPDVFVHISALKEMSRRPVVGDIIHFTATLHNGKPRAVTASIDGVPSVYKPAPPKEKAEKLKPRPAKRNYYEEIRNRPRKRSYSTSVLMLLLAIAFWAVSYYKTSARSPSHEAANASITQENKIHEPASRYHCEGKTRCSEMTSCEEAKFYLRNCPGVEIDGNHDGIPCEQQWCN